MAQQQITAKQVRDIFDSALVGETNPERIAKVELLREFFTNTEFRNAMRDEVARINGVL